MRAWKLASVLGELSSIKLTPICKVSEFTNAENDVVSSKDSRSRLPCFSRTVAMLELKVRSEPTESTTAPFFTTSPRMFQSRLSNSLPSSPGRGERFELMSTVSSSPLVVTSPSLMLALMVASMSPPLISAMLLNSYVRGSSGRSSDTSALKETSVYSPKMRPLILLAAAPAASPTAAVYVPPTSKVKESLSCGTVKLPEAFTASEDSPAAGQELRPIMVAVALPCRRSADASSVVSTTLASPLALCPRSVKAIVSEEPSCAQSIWK
mmetsp:Transcript_39564/g.86185  ORF Transcript_39564/g.86185 Transcript_39564/m.86185 type:complete len:267 (-) Transcript_39564:1190-1990(-)